MVSNILLGITVAVSILAFYQPWIIEKFIHNPYKEKHNSEYYRLLTSGFLHGSWSHLLINMFVLYQFGGMIEGYFEQRFGLQAGMMWFLFFYISAIIVANLGTYFAYQNRPNFNSLGASGATSALVMIYCLFDPWQMFVWPPVPAIILAVGFIGYSYWASRQGRDNVDHMGHMWGAIYGLVFMMVIDNQLMKDFVEKLMHPHIGF